MKWGRECWGNSSTIWVWQCLLVGMWVWALSDHLEECRSTAGRCKRRRRELHFCWGPWKCATSGPMAYDRCSELWVIGARATLSEINTKQWSFLPMYVDPAQPRKSGFSFILSILWSTYCVLEIGDDRYIHGCCPHVWSLTAWGSAWGCLLTLCGISA